VSEQSSTSALAKPTKDILAVIDSNPFKQELARALPNALKPDRVVRLAITMLRANASLQKCSPLSIMACVVESAQLGLELDQVLGHAYLVPFGGEASLIVGYRGFAHLMYQSGTISTISAEVVRAKDKFKRTLGTRRELVHDPAPIPLKDDPEDWLGAYAVVEFLTDKTEFEYLERVKIESARNRSRSWHAYKKDGKSTPWITDTEEMWRKTAIRRLAKRMPVSTTDKRPELLRATMIDEYSERRGLLIPTLHGFDVNPEPPEPDSEDPFEPTRATDVSHEAPARTNMTGGENSAVASESHADAGASPKNKKPSGPPKAKIPPAPPEQPKPKDDPFITTAEQTQVYNLASQAGWKVPDEVKSYLKKKYNIDTIKAVRKSQLPELLRVLKEGT
jgi:recombination protein RecT